MDSNDKGSKPLSRPGASAKPKAGTSESSSCSVTDSFMKKISTQPVPSVTPARPGRLRSFRQDKDLSLSPATGKFAIPPSLPANENPNRKKFQPTIPTKKKVQEVKKKKETSEENIPADKGSARGRGRGRGDGAVGRGRGRGRGNANYIQMTGSLYGQGVGGDLVSKRSSTGGSWGGRDGGREGGSSFSSDRPKLNRQDVKINREEDDAKLSKYLRDDFIDDGDDDPDSPVFAPIELPKSCLSGKLKEEIKVLKEECDERAVEQIGNLTIKQEKLEDDVKTEEKKTKVATADGRRLSPIQVTGSHIFQSDGNLIFFQLPDTLPSLVPGKERIKIEPGTEAPIEEIKTGQENVFKDMQDGRLGTLRIHKSGKITMKVGDHDFVIDSGTQVSFLQDLISVDVNAEEKAGKMTVLGPIKYKGVILPDWEKLVNN